MVNGFDPADLRRALGQYATGVTIVTARGPEGRRVGVTANSFTSVSLDPPLVLWSLARASESLPVFEAASHFAVNVLGAGQHDLSRRFARSRPDKFAGVPHAEGLGGAPLLPGAIARFECRAWRRHDGGDHVILLGEVQRYDQAGGEPLVFHSGSYRITTTHPDLPL